MKIFIPAVLLLVFSAGFLFSQEIVLNEIKDLNLKLALRASGNSNYSQMTSLRLNGNHIADIAPLGKMVQLAKLDLYNNRINDLGALSNLINLIQLNLGRNFFTDINPLSNLSNLVSLNLQNNKVRDIAPLRNLPNLKELDIRGLNVNLENFNYWKFSDNLGIYDKNGKYTVIKPDEKTKWGLLDGEVVPAYIDYKRTNF